MICGLCLERKLINPAKVVGCFGRYMEHEGHAISRAQFEQNLHGKQSDPEFMDDIAPLLSAAVDYDPRPGHEYGPRCFDRAYSGRAMARG